jgi:hypothetical protein
MWHLWHNVWSVFGRSRIIYHHFQQFPDISFINLTTMLVSVENPDRYNKMTVNTSDFSTSLETLTLEMVIGALTHISGVSLAVRSQHYPPSSPPARNTNILIRTLYYECTRIWHFLLRCICKWQETPLPPKLRHHDQKLVHSPCLKITI